MAQDRAVQRVSMRRWADESGAGSAPCRTAQGSDGASSFEPRRMTDQRKASRSSDDSTAWNGPWLSNLWLATASDGRGPHLIPLAYWWDGSRLTTATFEGSRTLKNVRAQPKVRAAIGTTGDVLMIDATATIATVADIADIAEVAKRYAQASGNDPQSVPGFVYILLVPERIQLWKGVAEFTGRTVMRAGVWLDDPID